MLGIEPQGLLVVLESQVELARLAVRVAEVVLRIGIAWILCRDLVERLQRGLPVLGLDRPLAGGIVGILGRGRKAVTSPAPGGDSRPSR